MSKNKFQISIANPCSENWELMTPTEKGRFCGSCQKAVVDFTEMTDKEIANVIKKNKSNSCGRFTANQLKKSIEIPQEHIFIDFLSHSFFRNVAMLSGIALLGSYNTFAQEKVKSVMVQNKTINEPNLIVENKQLINSNIIFKGVVKSSNDSITLEGATIKIINTNKQTITNSKGEFTLDLTDLNINKEFSVEISFIGYVNKKEILNLSKIPQNQTYFINEDIDALNEVIFVGYYKPISEPNKKEIKPKVIKFKKK